ncbi:MAG: glycosyltransferase family 4 protein [Desulfamplus sp.]|nr:glycosyltransferase family 4 protein [Desulfamplus sp.]
MKILHLISQAPDFTGSGKYIQAMIRCAAAKGHDNFLVAGVQDGFSMDSDLISLDRCRYVHFKGEDLPYPLPGMSDAMPYENTIFSQMSCVALAAYESVFKTTIEEAIEAFQPDIIHSHHLWLVTVLACDVAPHIPIVTTCHGTCLRQYTLCPEIRPKVSPSCQRIHRVIALSAHQKQEIEAIHGISTDQIDIIPGGYDDTLFFLPDKRENDRSAGGSDHSMEGGQKSGVKPPVTLEYRQDGSGKKRVVEMIYAGKLCRAKGLPWLLQALARIDAQGVPFPWRLHLAGSGVGEEKKQCLSLAEVLGSNVVVHGPLSHTDLGNLMRQCDLFILPSFFEGLPLVLMEALACGCRVLTTALPGTREVLGHQEESDANRLVTLIDLPTMETIDKPFDNDLPMLERLLADTLKSLISLIATESDKPDPRLFSALAGPFSWEKIFEKIEWVYEKAFFHSTTVKHPEKIADHKK